MSGVFDRLNKKMDLEKKDEGISILDLQDLPPELRRIMRFMLQEYEITYEELREEVKEMPGLEEMSEKELQEALKTLTIQGWLIKRGEEKILYQVNLRRKKGAKMAGGVWAALQARIIQHGETGAEGEEGKDSGAE